jgi:hypothetical protein
MMHYPYSATIRANIIDTPNEDNVQYCLYLTKQYCRAYGIKPDDLRKRRFVGANTRKINGVRIDMMRMALGYYLKSLTGVPDSSLGKIVGYLNGSSLAKMRPIAKAYIKNKDKYFYPYYEMVQKVY